MSHRYPRISTTLRESKIPSGKQPKCSCCMLPATARVTIETSYMRGDDETLHLCPQHFDVAWEGRFGDLFAYRDLELARRRKEAERQRAAAAARRGMPA